MIIYIIVNKVNSKKYIGQTTTSLKERWMKHLQPSSKYCRLLHRAITKYGKDNFNVRELKKCDSIIDLNYWEEYYIRTFNTLKPNGYNLLAGGNNRKHHEDTKRKMSASRTGKKIPKLSLARGPMSEERKLKISIAKKGNNGLLGIKRSGISKPTARKPVMAYNDIEKLTFSSIKEAATHFNKSHTNIVACLKGRKKSACGFNWKYI